MNTVSITGRLAADPELKKTQNGTSVCSFRLAVRRPRVKDVTDWLDCVAWRQSAEYLKQYGSKGSMVAVSGQLTSRNYETKDGSKRTAIEVVCDNVELIGDNKSEKPVNVEFEDIDDTGELPF